MEGLAGAIHVDLMPEETLVARSAFLQRKVFGCGRSRDLPNALSDSTPSIYGRQVQPRGGSRAEPAPWVGRYEQGLTESPTDSRLWNVEVGRDLHDLL